MQISLDHEYWIVKGYLGEDWLWRNAHKADTSDTQYWIPARVPGSIQYDLWKAGQILDPFFELNTRSLEWIPQRTWVYRCRFQPNPLLEGRRVFLHFEGVDYSARFFLNGELLGFHEGMFTPTVFEVGNQLAYGEDNLLAVVIDPAPQEQSQVGYTSKVRSGKSRMSYGWDFSPRLIHLGIWDRVYLEYSGPAIIRDVFVQPVLSDDLNRAIVAVQVELDSLIDQETDIRFKIVAPSGDLFVKQETVILVSGTNQLQIEMLIDQPLLWWPNGYGDQPLYQLEVEIGSLAPASERLQSFRQVTFGIRKVEFIQNYGNRRNALPYTLVVNNRRLYIKGWNWVPMDVFYGLEQPEKLQRLIELARRASVNLLRVWGGGLIEKEEFYNLCDSTGLLVMQEFIQSSSGIENTPPKDTEIIDRIVKEAQQIIPRRRNHPSLVIWCGGNELQDENEKPLDTTSHPLLAALSTVVKQLDPGRYWLPTSPSGPVFGFTLENIHHHPELLHDVHGPWEHQGLEGQYKLYNQGSSLLHSEFGVEGITNLPTLAKVISPGRRTPVSLKNPIWFHLGAWWVKESFWKKALGDIEELPRLVRGVQYLQASGLGYAVEADRRRAFENSGTIPWQYNEPYPMAASTSAVDYFAHPKPAYWAVVHAYSPIHVSARFDRQTWEAGSEFQASIIVSNSTGDAILGGLIQASMVNQDGSVLKTEAYRIDVEVQENNWAGNISYPVDEGVSPVWFLDLRLFDGDRLVDQNRYLFSSRRDLTSLWDIPLSQLKITKQVKGDLWELTIQNVGSSVALYLWLEDGRPVGSTGWMYPGDNYFCLVPGESRSIRVEWVHVKTGERMVNISGFNTGSEVIVQDIKAI